MNHNMATDILPFGPGFSETGWDHETATLAGSLFASALRLKSRASSPSGLHASRAGRKSGIGLGGIIVDTIVMPTASAVVERAVADLNARAVVSVAQTGDALVVRADNKAAGNTLRAYASSIRAQAFNLSGIHYVGYDTSITNRRGGMRKPRSPFVRTPSVEVRCPGDVDGSSSFRV